MHRNRLIEEIKLGVWALRGSTPGGLAQRHDYERISALHSFWVVKYGSQLKIFYKMGFFKVFTVILYFSILLHCIVQ
jgi:hypothetical protein